MEELLAKSIETTMIALNMTHLQSKPLFTTRPLSSDPEEHKIASAQIIAFSFFKKAAIFVS